jgi:hypothetical protein
MPTYPWLWSTPYSLFDPATKQSFGWLTRIQWRPILRTRDWRLGSATDFREVPLSDLLETVGESSGLDLTDELFASNRSVTAGRLKADVCVEVARRLLSAHVNSSADLAARASSDTSVRSAWIGVHGLEWVTRQYFCALNGIDDIKPDVMLTRFVSASLGRLVGAKQTDLLLTEVHRQLTKTDPALTKRALDHTLWRFESGRHLD